MRSSMFHSDEEGNVDDVKFIDFQTYCFADLFLDLSHFVGTSLKDEVKLHRIGELLDAYFESFISILIIMDIDVGAYTRHQKFDDRFRAIAVHEFLHCALVLNLFTADSDKDIRDDRNHSMASMMTFSRKVLYYEKIMQN